MSCRLLPAGLLPAGLLPAGLLPAGLLPALLLLLAGQALAAESRWEQLAADLDASRREHDVPALGLVLLDDGELVMLRGYGSATPDTPLRWGSISKTFTALGALLLADTKGFGLDSPIRPLLGSGYYVNRWAQTHPVRLSHLVELSAGLGDLSRAEFDDNQPRPLWEALQRNQSSRRTLWPPGLQHSYSNAAPGLTAAVIERLAGAPFEDYMQAAVLEPAGMTRASFEPVAGLPGGFKADGKTEIPYWHMTFPAFGGLNASMAEMARFLSILINDGRVADRRVFPAEVVDRVFEPRATLGARRGLEVSYGAGSYGWVRDGHTFWGHGGDADGYQSRYGLLKAPGRGYAVIINTDNPRLLRQLQRRIEGVLLEDLLPRSHPAKGADPDLDSYVGTYYPSSVRFAVGAWQEGDGRLAEVRRDGETLVFSRLSDTRRDIQLLPLGNGRFRRAGDPAVTAVFVESEGTLYLQGELGNYLNLTKGRCPDFIARCR